MTDVDELNDTMVLMGDETIPAGEAARRLRERWGSKHISIRNHGGCCFVRNMQGGEEAMLPIVPPRTHTAAARANVSRGKYASRGRKPR